MDRRRQLDRRGRALPALAVLLVLLALGAPSAAAQQLTGITLTPARTAAVGIPGETYGPFGLTNNTGNDFKVHAFPTFIDQDRGGGFVVRDDPGAIEEASRYLRVTGGFDLSSGESESATARLLRRTSDHNFYGGLLFRARPARGESVPQIEAIYQLNEAMLLRPPPALQRIGVDAEPIRAEQAGDHIRLLAGVRNTGNTDVTPRGEVRVADADGNQVAVQPLQRIQIIPGAVVDLPAVLDESLPAGNYEVEATLYAGRQKLTTTGSMELTAPNEVKSENARLLDFPVPAAYRGDPVDVQASFKNTGNVPYAPRAEVVAQTVGPRGEIGEASKPLPLAVETAAPGGEGEIRGQIELPDNETKSYQLTLRIRAGDRELDSRAVTVALTSRPGLATRFGNWITDHAVAIVLVLLGALTVMAVLFASYVRRLQERSRAAPRTRKSGRSAAARRPAGSARKVKSTRPRAGASSARPQTRKPRSPSRSSKSPPRSSKSPSRSSNGKSPRRRKTKTGAR
ncbi:MAG: hypothetical protein ACJ75Z_08210 [Solirubrobacterales bacterium]